MTGTAHQNDRPVVISPVKNYRLIHVFVVGYFLILVWVLWYGSLPVSRPSSLRPPPSLLVLLVPVDMLIRPVVPCTTHAGGMLIRTVVLFTIEESCSNGSSRSKCLPQS